MIQVGIHENLVLNKATKNDRGTLVVGWRQATETDQLASFDDSSDGTSSGSPEQDFLVFGPQALGRDGNIDTPDNISKKIKELKDQLNHILLAYMPSTSIKWETMRGCGITAENLSEKLKDQAILDKIYTNVVDQFIAQITPFVNKDTLRFRVLFVRGSMTKHYPGLRKRFLTAEPFIESMSVPKSASKLKFSKWEIEKGLNSGEALTAADSVNSGEAADAASVFGGR